MINFEKDEIKTEIMNRLKKIEQAENVKILLAVESGSRAWGFASSDSDYDVRFIYARPKDEYLKLNRESDVIGLPLDGIYDINGWDLDKTLKLLYKSNPTLFEWFSSPIIYIETEFAEKFRKIMNKYFSSKKGLYHYISMAKGNYREYLKSDIVWAKKYFYVIRPILACKWIIENKTPPPMKFSELAESQLEEDMVLEINKLIDIKINSPEVKYIEKVDILNQYIEKNIEEIEKETKLLPNESITEWKELNTLFLETVNNI